MGQREIPATLTRHWARGYVLPRVLQPTPATTLQPSALNPQPSNPTPHTGNSLAATLVDSLPLGAKFDLHSTRGKSNQEPIQCKGQIRVASSSKCVERSNQSSPPLRGRVLVNQAGVGAGRALTRGHGCKGVRSPVDMGAAREVKRGGSGSPFRLAQPPPPSPPSQPTPTPSPHPQTCRRRPGQGYACHSTARPCVEGGCRGKM